MQNKRMKKMTIILVSIFFMLAVPMIIFAQERVESALKIIAEVDIFDSHIVNQKNHEMIVDFTLNNGKGVQSDIRYSVELIKESPDKVRTTAYFKVYEDKVTLDQNSKVYKKISVKIPDYINGEYELWLTAKNGDGLPLSGNFVGKVKFESSNTQHIEIDETSCKLYIKDIPGEYYLSQGVDINLSENLMLSCMAKSFFDKKVEIEPHFNISKRSAFGERVSLSDSFSKISFNSGEKKEILLAVPKPNEPQSYNASLFLKMNNQEISNAVNIHYVIQGEGASISNLQLDKKEYKNGEKALVSFVWSLSADSFPDSRSGKVDNAEAFYSLSIEDKDKRACITPIVHQALKKDGATSELLLNITDDCLEPLVKLTIENQAGKILAKREYNFVIDDGAENVKDDIVSSAKKQENVANYGNDFSPRKIALSIAVLIMVSGLALTIITLVRKKPTNLILLFILGGSIFMANKADATTVTGTFGSSTYACAFGLSTTSVGPGGSFTGTASNCTIVACLNEMRIRAYVNGVELYSGSVANGSGGGTITTRLNWTGSNSTTINAPGSCGGYSVPVKVEFDHESSGGWNYVSASDNLGYNVVNCAVNGACGSRNTNYENNITAWPGGSTWCSSGNDNLLNGTPSFPNPGDYSVTWGCSGYNGGTSVTNCVASRKLPPPSVVDLIIQDDTDDNVLVDKITNPSIKKEWSTVGATHCEGQGLFWHQPFASVGISQPDPPAEYNATPFVARTSSGQANYSTVYDLSCYNQNGADTTTRSNTVTDNVSIAVNCTTDLNPPWGPCNRECGTDGLQYRTVRYPNCYEQVQDQPCNRIPCPVTSEWKEVK